MERTLRKRTNVNYTEPDENEDFGSSSEDDNSDDQNFDFSAVTEMMNKSSKTAKITPKPQIFEEEESEGYSEEELALEEPPKKKRKKNKKKEKEKKKNKTKELPPSNVEKILAVREHKPDLDEPSETDPLYVMIEKDQDLSPFVGKPAEFLSDEDECWHRVKILAFKNQKVEVCLHSLGEEEGKEMLDMNKDQLRLVIEPDDSWVGAYGYFRRLLRSTEKVVTRRIRDDEEFAKKKKEYFVKWKGFSYMHCEWVTDKWFRNHKDYGIKIDSWKRRKHKAGLRWYNGIPCYYPPAFATIDHIITHKAASRKDKSKAKRKYLIKWSNLPYSEATWETFNDLDTVMGEEHMERLIKKYEKFLKSLPKKPKPKRQKGAEKTRPPNPAGDTGGKTASLCKLKPGFELKSYQKDGVDWLAFNWHQARNSMLADEMGLGKTVQSVAMMNYLATKMKIRGPFLVIAPLSTVIHWKREAERFTRLHPIIYHGDATSRDVLREFEFHVRDSNNKKMTNTYRFNILISTFDMLQRDPNTFGRIQFELLVVDEAHKMKNKFGDTYAKLKRLKTTHTVLLTGTPVQNNVAELHALLSFLDAEKFSDVTAFEKQFGEISKLGQVEELQKLLGPYVLRRLKSDVELSIKPRLETIVKVELTPYQKKVYKAVYEKNLDALMQKTKRVANMKNIAMQLRKVCNHPYLIRGVEENVCKEMKLTTETQIMTQLVQSSGKFVLLDKLLAKLKEEGHRVLIYSQMTAVLDVIEDWLNFKQYKFERLDGSVASNDRQESIDRFTDSKQNRFVFLLSTKAGGVGINLTSADTVIIYDSDWNPQNDIQAQARCHRIGQTKQVQVYRFITRGTYEEQMFARASEKLALDEAILHSMREKGVKHNRAEREELHKMLKLGAKYFLDEDDTKAEKFCEDDIDDILKCAKTVEIESGSSVLTNSSLSKAVFVSKESDEKVQLNDPDFWKKMGFEHKKEEKKILGKRKRKSINYATAGHVSFSDDSDFDSETSSDSDSQEGDDNYDVTVDAALEQEEETSSEEDGEPEPLDKPKKKKQKNKPKSPPQKDAVVDLTQLDDTPVVTQAHPRKRKLSSTNLPPAKRVAVPEHPRFQSHQTVTTMPQAGAPTMAHHTQSSFTPWNFTGTYRPGNRASGEYQVNTIRIMNIQNRRGELATAEFSVGGAVWRVLVYPFGKQNFNMGMSVYLHHLRSERPDQIAVDTEFKCTIYSTVSSEQDLSRQLRTIFNKRDAIRGFDVFIPTQRLQSGQYLFENKDTVILRVELWCYQKYMQGQGIPNMQNGVGMPNVQKGLRPPKNFKPGRYLNREKDDHDDLTKVPALEEDLNLNPKT